VSVELLDSPIRKYAWGSRTAIAALQGRPSPAAEPEAELWMGAHPASPSRLAVSGTPLTDAIAADPAGLLGDSAVRRFGPRLPFLLKILAAAQPLSLQAHPTLAQARAAHEAGHPSYVDAWHKPEMLVALTEFDALCGFRDPAVTAAELAALGVAGLEETIGALRQADPATALHDAVRGLLGKPDSRLVEEVVAASPGTSLAAELAERYPGDPGVIVAMLLNRVRLHPGEAVWMPAGNLHAYLRGVGVEIMAASDNVLRGGLTPKAVDVDELLRVLRFEVLHDPVTRPTQLAPDRPGALVTWPVPVDDFALHRAVVDAGTPAVRLPGGGPRIVLCVRGGVRVDDGVLPVTLQAGQAAFAPASRRELAVSGDGDVFQAATP
jgi:mannose-6-phosphate isomerase